MRLFTRTKGSDIDAVTASQLVDRNHATLIDVREAEEWEVGHAPAAIHMPLGGLVASEVTNDKLVIAVCRSGGRSAKATALLRAGGIDVRNLTGGMQAWSAAGLPVCRDDGSSGIVS
jgi:rhodanese-related sulfurtransferase